MYGNLSIEELQQKLAEQKDLFEEVTEERMIILGQENLHLSSKLVIKYQQELDEIKESIEKIEHLLREKQGE
jgi:hypothetical protein